MDMAKIKRWLAALFKSHLTILVITWPDFYDLSQLNSPLLFELLLVSAEYMTSVRMEYFLPDISSEPSWRISCWNISTEPVMW